MSVFFKSPCKYKDKFYFPYPFSHFFFNKPDLESHQKFKSFLKIITNKGIDIT